MPAYLGPAGSLVEFHCSASTVAEDRPMSYRRTLGGRVKAQRGPLSRRSWSVDIGTATPGDLAGLMALLQGGMPPWVYVDPYAQVTNLLSPEQSILSAGSWLGADAYEGGSAVTSDGIRTPRTVTSLAGAAIVFGFRVGVADHAAVVPGIPVTVSAYVRGSGLVSAEFLDWSGALIGAAVTAAYTHTGLSRASVTATPPAGATMVRLSVTGASQATMPAVTWTPVVAGWSVGRGCNSALAEGLSEAVQMAVREVPSMRRSQVSFTVREIG